MPLGMVEGCQEVWIDQQWMAQEPIRVLLAPLKNPFRGCNNEPRRLIGGISSPLSRVLVKE